MNARDFPPLDDGMEFAQVDMVNREAEQALQRDVYEKLISRVLPEKAIWPIRMTVTAASTL